MRQTPASEGHNPEALELIPEACSRLIEIGCSSGALAREFKKLHPAAHFVGVDIEADYADLARRYCDEVLTMDIEAAEEAFFESHRDRDCWLFVDSLEHLRDPWHVLRRIRQVIPRHGSVVACVPNAQNWVVIANLCIGEFNYADVGLYDRTHLRWFTRKSLTAMFSETGFIITEATSRVFDQGPKDKYLPVIGEMARAAGVDPRVAMGDAVPFQYVVRAEPA